MDNPNVVSTGKIERSLNLVCGSGLAGLSALLTLGLFLTLAQGNPMNQIIMGSLAVFLELGKVLLFRKKGWYRAIGVLLILLSGLASFGSALLVVESNQATMTKANQVEARSSDSYENGMTEIESLDTQISILVDRLKSYPDNFFSASKDLNSQIQTLRTQRAETLRNLDSKPIEIEHSENEPTKMTMLSLFSDLLKLPIGYVEMGILMFLSVLIELSTISLLTVPNPRLQKQEANGQPTNHRIGNSDNMASEKTPTNQDCRETVQNVHETDKGKVSTLVLNSHEKTSQQPSMKPLRENVSPDEFLEAMTDPESHFLLGRDRTCEILGIPSFTGRKLIRRLMDEGKIQAVGKRLVRYQRSDPTTYTKPRTSEEGEAS